MASKTKQQIISEKDLEIRELQSTLMKSDIALKQFEFSVAEIKKVVTKQNWELQYLRNDKEVMQNKFNDLVSTQIARIEAVKMLWGIMSSAGTHRQKSSFAEQAIIIAQTEIDKLKRDVFNISDSLPF